MRRALAVALLGASLGATAADLQGCRLPRIAQEVRCGQVEVAENPRAPDGRRLRIQFAVVPALAKNKAPDPLFVLAGGPGQSARQVAGAMLPVLARVNARRDLVFVDQRGTGGSHPLTCPQPKVEPLASSLDPHRQLEALRACVAALPADTRHYATWLAARDFDAVREALGAAQINLWGASYGSRLALEYLRQFPLRVRSVVLDGVAPPDMALPASFAVDAEAALSALLAACERDMACRARHPRLAQRLDGLFGRLTQAPLPITVAHPLTGEPQAFALTRDMLAAALRVPLYAPTLAALLPHAIERAAQQDFAPLLALPVAVAADDAARVAIVQHYAVICAEDLPRIDAAARRAAAATRFGTTLLQQYEAACARVPHAPAPPEFYALSGAAVPVLLLSGALDPVTPPRHGERVARALANARHLVAPHLAHGISAHGCGPELIARFIRQAHFDGIDGACLQRLPAPPFFVPPALADR